MNRKSPTIDGRFWVHLVKVRRQRRRQAKKYIMSPCRAVLGGFRPCYPKTKANKHGIKLKPNLPPLSGAARNLR